jgi:hypothetical protein
MIRRECFAETFGAGKGLHRHLDGLGWAISEGDP